MGRLLLKLFRRRTLHEDLEAELAFHREMAATGNNPIPLGNTANITEQGLDLWRFTSIENLWRDLVYAARGLRRSPAFVSSALLSLGLGIGVNAAVFSLAVTFLFSEPSVSDSRSVVYVQVGHNTWAQPHVLDFVRESGVFQDVTGENAEAGINWNDGSETRHLFSVVTTKNYFTTLGTPVAHGRGWTPDDPDEVVVLHHNFWQKHFSGDPSVVGRTINLDGRAYTVLGILPEGHRTLLGFGLSPDVYLPSYLNDFMLGMYARLRPGVSLGEAQARLAAVGDRLDASFPEQWKYRDELRVSPITGIARLEAEPAVMPIGIFFAMLLVVVGLVLLIACVNVAGLLLARASARRQEIAIRLSLGASRRRLLQQMLVESALLSLLGAGLGFLFAYAVATLAARIQLPLPIPIRLHMDLDWRVVLYSALLAIAATLACGLLPAWQSVKESISSHLPTRTANAAAPRARRRANGRCGHRARDRFCVPDESVPFGGNRSRLRRTQHASGARGSATRTLQRSRAPCQVRQSGTACARSASRHRSRRRRSQHSVQRRHTTPPRPHVSRYWREDTCQLPLERCHGRVLPRDGRSRPRWPSVLEQ
ncbi:MAG: FtsX-like permease family protein [Luteitalea sp.]|nr:FtsX-like permease family protein [Luteitalea sp.]